MAIVLPVQGVAPVFGERAFLAPNATIVGQVVCGDDCSFWFNSVVRGDVNSIVLGHRVNVQDGAVIHCTYQRSKTVIGNNVSLGHNAIVHGCEIHDNVLVGMGAIVMDGCVIESGSVIAAGAVLLENTHVTAGSLWAGTPAKFIKPVSEKLRSGEIERIAKNYLLYASWFSNIPT